MMRFLQCKAYENVHRFYRNLHLCIDISIVSFYLTCIITCLYIYNHETIQLYHNEFLTKSLKLFLAGMSSTLADDAMSWFLRIGQN